MATEVIAALITGAATLAAVVLAWHMKGRRASRIDDKSESDTQVESAAPAPHDSPATSIGDRLLQILWLYPEPGELSACWAVKESDVIRGNLDLAQQQPGLGIAIMSTEAAIHAFGDHAAEKLEGVVAWGMGKAQADKPNLVLTKDPRTSDETLPDLRHTLALAIILARTRKHIARLRQYVEFALSKQRPQSGGWPQGEDVMGSELFSSVYALELIGLCIEEYTEWTTLLERSRKAIFDGTNWLCNEHTNTGVWTSRLFGGALWEPLWATAWVLRRLTPINSIHSSNYAHHASQAMQRLIQCASNPATWEGTPEDQRFRVEARVASAVAVGMKKLATEDATRDQANTYMFVWRRRANRLIGKMKDQEIDLATALFLLDSLVDQKKLNQIGQRVATRGMVCT